MPSYSKPVKHFWPAIPVNVGDGELPMLNLLVGWSLGMSVLSAAVFWLNLQWQNERQTLRLTHTQQDVRALMDTLVHDIRRANFQGLVPNKLPGNSGACPSAFCGLPEDFDLSRNQILFSVDRNGNGVKDNNECSGFRVNNKVLQTKTSCQPVVWTSLSDSKNLQILELTFQIQCDNSPNSPGDILSVSLSSQSTFDKLPQTWQRWVQARNHSVRNRPAALSCK
jgi:type II secretory pathway component PulJ